MKIKRCILPGREVRSLGILYDEMARQLGFPPYFGRNLDALWDVLAADIEGPVEVVWSETERSRELMGDDFDRVVKVLRDVETERDDFRVIMSDGGRT